MKIKLISLYLVISRCGISAYLCNTEDGGRNHFYRSFVHFSIDPEHVVLDYISLGMTPLMQIFEVSAGFLPMAVTSFVFLSLHVTLSLSGESEIKS